MSGAGWLPAPAAELFGAEATAEEFYEVLTVDVPPGSWVSALLTARDELGCTYFDWLSAVDEPGTGFRVAAHVVALNPLRRLLVRTTVPHEAPALPTAVEVYAGAAWHERETHEMFGIGFPGHPALDHLLLPDTFEGHPLRKDFVLAARVAKAWPGAKEPGESDHGGPKRRQMLPPGVPDPNEWGPMKGRLPAAPARPARGAARAAGERPAARAAGDRPVRRTRTAAEGSASQSGPSDRGSRANEASEAVERGAAARPRRMRSASQGSASQTAPGAAAPGPDTPAQDTAPAGAPTQRPEQTPRPDGPERRERPEQTGRPDGREQTGRPDGPERPAAAEGGTTPSPSPSTTQEEAAPAPPAGPRRMRSASGGSTSQRSRPEASAPKEPQPVTPPAPARAPRSSDAPWHHARPAFDEPGPANRRQEPGAAAGAPAESPAGTPAESPAGTSAEAGADAPAEPPVPDVPDAPAGPEPAAGPDTPHGRDDSRGDHRKDDRGNSREDDREGGPR
ncbi:NADH-quinone oxidoreductase subunit C [Streptomyces sp. NPDC006743]|uniref:NADH-quinone oxidoreductase subunit C n=1 Tax=Streptomyces sp. NPDC006743 TaxID=3154480 RepID=UPI003451D839